MKVKLKVALICHFSNDEIQSLINPWKKVPEFAQWITFLTTLFEKNNNLELYVISPHKYISRSHSLTIRNVHYYFFNAHVPVLGRHWPGLLKVDFWSDFWFNKIKIKKIIRKINPDIIHYFGIENAYYSSSIFQFKEMYPIVITVQGFVGETTSNVTYQLKKSIIIENKIIESFSAYISNNKTISLKILDKNPNAKLFQIHLPIRVPKLYSLTKKFDLVFFARICADKGIGDLLEAVKIVKKSRNDISLCVIGAGNSKEFEQLAKTFKISPNIFWAGCLPSQDDVHKLASQAKISVLPTHHEIISGTIIESLYLKLPVIAYNVGSIFEINENEEIVILVEKFNVKKLAESIINLLNSPQRQQELAEKGFKRIKEMFSVDENKIKNDLQKAYLSVIQNFHEVQNKHY
jgi:glycosyltransferase involved in cell wall biosynthesis